MKNKDINIVTNIACTELDEKMYESTFNMIYTCDFKILQRTAKTHRPDLLILCCSFLNPENRKNLNQFVQYTFNHKIPVILIIEKKEKNRFMDLIQLENVEYLYKPIDKEDFFACIEEQIVWNRKHRNREALHLNPE